MRRPCDRVRVALARAAARSPLVPPGARRRASSSTAIRSIPAAVAVRDPARSAARDRRAPTVGSAPPTTSSIPSVDRRHRSGRAARRGARGQARFRPRRGAQRRRDRDRRRCAAPASRFRSTSTSPTARSGRRHPYGNLLAAADMVGLAGDRACSSPIANGDGVIGPHRQGSASATCARSPSSSRSAPRSRSSTRAASPSGTIVATVGGPPSAGGVTVVATAIGVHRRVRSRRSSKGAVPTGPGDHDGAAVPPRARSGAHLHRRRSARRSTAR